MFLAVVHPDTQSKSARSGSGRRRIGCALGCLASSLLLIVLLMSGWLLIGRPLAHGMVEQELAKAMSAAVNQIPAQAPLLPPGSVIPVQENVLNNLIVLNLAPSDPVQQPTTSITSNSIRIEFQIYGQQCAISGLPKVVNGQLTATNIQVEGLLGLILSPEELTIQLNQYLIEAQTHLKHSVRSIQLKDHEMDLTLD